ncbi:hypothetical protein RCL_jg11200.t1 [Rhizophagus clarus]|uniref:Uncharacterized protein n=1 Tax=Rhizophagus clarus TaxID=94130 RepID=A0A8H3MCT1_9GLOM|nr:hypothetical protein RCL_jg11200.t1 [Rhizophagus clarus]
MMMNDGWICHIKKKRGTIGKIREYCIIDEVIYEEFSLCRSRKKKLFKLKYLYINLKKRKKKIWLDGLTLIYFEANRIIGRIFFFFWNFQKIKHELKFDIF